jgi:porin
LFLRNQYIHHHDFPHTILQALPSERQPLKLCYDEERSTGRDAGFPVSIFVFLRGHKKCQQPYGVHMRIDRIARCATARRISRCANLLISATILLSMSTIAAAEVADTQSTEPATEPATTPAISAPTLTLLPPPDADDIAAAPSTQPSNHDDFNPHPPDDINLTLKEANRQPAGILPYGPVSLAYPFWKQGTDALRDKYALSLGAETVFVYQGATQGPGDREAGGGYTSLFGSWRLVGTPDARNNGYLNFKVDYQWQIGSEAPKALGGQIGSLWNTTKGMGETPVQISQLSWRQRFLNSLFVFDFGKLDPTNYYSTNVWSSDRQFFMNAAFSTAPAIAYPSNGFGANLRFNPASWLYLAAGFQNEHGNDSTSGFTRLGDMDLFSAAEVGFTPRIPGMGVGNYRATLWNADPVPSESKQSDEGFALSIDQAITPQLVPFARYEYSETDLLKTRQLAAAGIGFHGHFFSEEDVCGVGFAWGQPSKSNLRDQYVAEAFYRVQVSQTDQFSVGYQLILDPSNSSEDAVGVLWLRFRILF